MNISGWEANELLTNIFKQIEDSPVLPENVFSEETLKGWAERDISTAREVVAENSDPEDVFSTKELESWAEANGYIKKE